MRHNRIIGFISLLCTLSAVAGCGGNQEDSDGGPWKEVVASTFYIGEEAGASNANIDNISTAWNSHAVRDFGGVDRWGPKNPEEWEGPWYKRYGYLPAGFKPKQNAWYVALPTPDHDSKGRLTAAIPWVKSASAYLPELKKFKNGVFGETESPFKNLWVEVRLGSKSAFAQLEDIGPSAHTGAIVADYSYVWGDASKPKNKFRMSAGIDISPAITDFLSTGGKATVRWRFVPASQVPKGPWMVTVTKTGPNWG